VWVNETRPRLQGARLTTYELMRSGVPMHLIADSAAGMLMRDGRVDVVLGIVIIIIIIITIIIIIIIISIISIIVINIIIIANSVNLIVLMTIHTHTQYTQLTFTHTHTHTHLHTHIHTHALHNIITHIPVGADRVAANGDTANKIGTYQIAFMWQRLPVLLI